MWWSALTCDHVQNNFNTNNLTTVNLTNFTRIRQLGIILRHYLVISRQNLVIPETLSGYFETISFYFQIFSRYFKTAICCLIEPTLMSGTGGQKMLTDSLLNQHSTTADINIPLLFLLHGGSACDMPADLCYSPTLHRSREKTSAQLRWGRRVFFLFFFFWSVVSEEFQELLCFSVLGINEENLLTRKMSNLCDNPLRMDNQKSLGEKKKNDVFYQVSFFLSHTELHCKSPAGLRSFL